MMKVCLFVCCLLLVAVTGLYACCLLLFVVVIISIECFFPKLFFARFVVNKHPWAWLLKHVRIPRSAGECVACPPNGSTVDVQVLNAARLLERSVGVSVLIFELFVTSILLSNGIVWFWFGT
jgi:hypothetical protein